MNSGYESSSSMDEPSTTGWSSSDENDSGRDSSVVGSPLICIANEEREAVRRSIFVRSEEEEREVRLFADILVNLNEVRVASSSPALSNLARDSTLRTSDSIQKKKRRRTSPDQLRVLESFFETNKMPSQTTRQKLAEKLGMSTRRVQIWFQNKRAKLKRTGGSKDESEHDHDSLPGSPAMSYAPSSPMSALDAVAILSAAASFQSVVNAPAIDYSSFVVPAYAKVM